MILEGSTRPRPTCSKLPTSQAGLAFPAGPPIADRILGAAPGSVRSRHAGDVDGNGDPIAVTQWNPVGDTLRYLRITTMVRTDRPDRGYKAPELGRIEDRDYNDPEHEKFNETRERRYRRRRLETVVDMRNL